MARKRIYRATKGKDGIKHSATLISVHGNGSNVQEMVLAETTVGDRSLDGSGQTIRESATTGNLVQTSDIIKYINLKIQSTVTQAGEDQFANGFIEWAIVFRREVDIPIPSTNLGTLTLPVIATRMFRGDCLMTGTFPIAFTLPNQTDIMLKLPKKAIKFMIGNQLKLYFIFRSGQSTDLETDTIKTLTSTIFKVYS